MGYLDNSTITVDAILTNRGRELLAQNDFSITKFALADDEVDYRLYNLSVLGTANAGAVIENMPVLEATPDETLLMKYKLVTVDRNALIGLDGSYVLPRIITGVSGNAQTIYRTAGANAPSSITFTPRTSYITAVGAAPSSQVEAGKYTVVVGDSTLVRVTADGNTDTVRVSTRGSTVATGNQFVISIPLANARQGNTLVTVFGNDSGATTSFTLAVE